VRRIWGVGPATQKKLTRLGVGTVGELAELPEATLVHAVGEAAGRQLHALAWNRDARLVEPGRAVKSIGHEETFARDHHELETLQRELLRMADAVANRLRNAGVTGRTVQVKVRFNDFRTITRSETVPDGIDDVTALMRVGRRLLAGVDPGPGVRLLGISVAQLAEGAPRQLSFDDGGTAGATAAVDDIRRRFGDTAIGPAALAGRAPKRRGDAQWGPDR
jgi:DNA polymerase-4